MPWRVHEIVMLAVCAVLLAGVAFALVQPTPPVKAGVAPVIATTPAAPKPKPTPPVSAGKCRPVTAVITVCPSP